MKNCLVVFTICLVASGVVYGQNISGSQSGTLGPGSYNVVDSIYVEAGNTLVINPGTDFLFMGAFGFGVAGELLAVGTQTDSINFMPAFGVPFWNGFEITSSAAPTCELQYCLITGSADMGIFLNYGDATISHCTFTMNSSVDMGGGIYSMYSASSISHCVFSYNTAVHGGGLVLRWEAPVQVDNLVFYGNNATYGGAIAEYFVSGFALTNCLFYQNSANQGGAIRLSSSPSETVNCTFADNTASQGAALFIINQTPVARNIVAWGNIGDTQINVYAGGFTCTYSDVQGGFAGTGNINVDPEFVTGPDGDYYLSQVAAGQTTTSQCVDTGDPASAMITGSTRTDCVQDAGVVDMGYHYASAPSTNDIDIELTYIAGSPVPPTGGQVDYTAEIWNNETSLVNFDAWLDLTLPNSNVITLVNRELGMPGGAYILRALFLTVPGTAPAGTYTMTGKVGDNPGVIWDQSSFDFEKTAELDGAFDPAMITISGWFEPDDLVQAKEIPDKFALNGAYPNPFNPTTKISYALPEAARVTLSVYDISGRLVTELVDGWRDAGVHEVTFDATGLASGVYVYRIQAGDNIVAKKMILTK
jgi:hypothetical protein